MSSCPSITLLCSRVDTNPQLVSHFCPGAVLRHDVESLRPWLEELQNHTETIKEVDWRTGGGLFLRYIDLCRNKHAIGVCSPRLFPLSRHMSPT
jgi:hypothetical protein